MKRLKQKSPNCRFCKLKPDLTSGSSEIWLSEITLKKKQNNNQMKRE